MYVSTEVAGPRGILGLVTQDTRGDEAASEPDTEPESLARLESGDVGCVVA